MNSFRYMFEIVCDSELIFYVAEKETTNVSKIFILSYTVAILYIYLKNFIHAYLPSVSFSIPLSPIPSQQIPCVHVCVIGFNYCYLYQHG